MAIKGRNWWSTTPPSWFAMWMDLASFWRRSPAISFLMFRELFLFSMGFQIAVLSFHSNLLLKLAIFLLEWPPKKNSQPTNIEYLAKQCYCDRLGLFFFLDGSPNKIDLVRDAQKLLTSHTSPPWSSSTLPLCPDFPMEAESGGSDRESWLLVAVQVLHKHGPCHPKKQLLKKQLVASCKLHTKWFHNI